MKYGKAVVFDENKHKYLSYENTLGVADGLIFNADPGVMDEYNSLDENGKKNFDTSKLGKNIEFYGYDGTDGKLDLSKAFTKSSFIFDGVDDYIQFPYDRTNEFEDGFTFEFYGKMEDIGTRCEKGEYKSKTSNDDGEYTCGLIHIYGLDDETSDFWGARFGCHCLENEITDVYFTLCPSDSKWTGSSVSKKGWSGEAYSWVQYIDFNNDFNEDFYFTIVYDALKGVEIMYINGEENERAEIDHLYWECFLEQIGKMERKLCIGRVADTYTNNWLYSDFECFSMRLYKRALNEDEVLKNFKASVNYHDYLEQNTK